MRSVVGLSSGVAFASSYALLNASARFRTGLGVCRAREKNFAADDARFFAQRLSIRSTVELIFANLATKSMLAAIGFARLKFLAAVRAFDRNEVVRIVPRCVLRIRFHRQVVNLVAVFAVFAVMNSATLRYLAVVENPNVLVQRYSRPIIPRRVFAKRQVVEL